MDNEGCLKSRNVHYCLNTLCWKHQLCQSCKNKICDSKGQRESGRCETWSSAATKSDFHPPFGLRTLFTVLGSHPTIQLASMGILARFSYRPPPPLCISRPLANCSWPLERDGQVYFLLGGPFKVAAGPLPRHCWCIRWGSLMWSRWDSFITAALHLIVPVKGDQLVSCLPAVKSEWV